MKDLLKCLSQAAVKVVLRVAGYTTLGLVLNISLLAIFWGALASQPHAVTIAIAIIMMLAFAVFFFLLGKSQGMTAAIYFLLKQHGPIVIGLIIDRIITFEPELLKDPAARQRLRDDTLPKLKQKLSDLPWVVRWLIGYFIGEINIIEAIEKALSELVQFDGDEAALRAQLSTKIADHINLDEWRPDWIMPVILVAVNIGLFAANSHFTARMVGG